MKFQRALIWFLVFIVIIFSALLVNAAPDGPIATLTSSKKAPAGSAPTTVSSTAAPTSSTAAPTSSTATPTGSAPTTVSSTAAPTSSTATPTGSAATPASSAAAPAVPIKVKAVTGKLALNNEITVEVENLKKYLEQPGKDYNKFILYLDWRPLKGLKVRRIDDTDKLTFDIIRTADSKDQWNALLGSPRDWTRMVPVSIGYESEKPIQSDKEYGLIVIQKSWFWVFIAFFLFVLFLFFYFAAKTNIIREPSKWPLGQKSPFSLGRTQMAFWFFVIAVSYVCIWMITTDLESITESALGLMGISAATALGAVVVDSSKHNEAESKLPNLITEQTTLDNRLKMLDDRLKALPAEITAAVSDPQKELLLKKENDEKEQEKAEKNARLTQVNNEIANLTVALAPKKSEGFLKDMVSDVNGISLHRFQIFIWTIVLGIIFLYTMFQSLAMPQFSGTLLALMGISSGTYIGFKFPEKKN